MKATIDNWFKSLSEEDKEKIYNQYKDAEIAIAVKSIVDKIYEAGMTELNFIYNKGPIIQKNGSRYKILSIYVEGNMLFIDGVKVYPNYENKLVPMLVDNTWRKISVNRIKNIVEQEINKNIKDHEI